MKKKNRRLFKKKYRREVENDINKELNDMQWQVNSGFFGFEKGEYMREDRLNYIEKEISKTPLY